MAEARRLALDPALVEHPAPRFVFLEALRITLGRPPIWLAVWSIELLLALAPAFVWHDWMRDATAHRYKPGSLVANLDTIFRFDQRNALGLLDTTTARVGAVLALIAMLFGCFCAGGWLQVFLERTHGHSLRRFFLGGSRYFWRFFRVLLLTILLLALASFVVYGTPWNTVVLKWMYGVPVSDWDRLETLASEPVAIGLRWSQAALYTLLVGLVLAWGDYTRTRLALHDTASAVWAGLTSAFTLLRHPRRTLRPLIALFLFEALIAFGAGTFSRTIEGDLSRRGDVIAITILLLTAQFVLLWRVVLRGARYHAAVQTSRRVVRPIARPDPWKASVGAPGAPRYPIGGDEYGMSL